MADEERINPEEDPEAALEALAEGPAPESPARRRRLARAALYGFRDARRSARIGMAVAAAALAVAIAVGVLALTRDSGGTETVRGGGAGAVTDDIVAKARGGTIYIRSRGLNQQSTGTGVLVDAGEGLVLEGRTAIDLGDQSQVKQGDPVVALGYPVSASGGRSLTSTAGVVSSVNTPLRIAARNQPRFNNLVQTDAALGAGNSGGPLVGADGKLVGVNTILFTGDRRNPSAAQGYAIGVDRVRGVLDDFRSGHSRGWFGAGLLPPPPTLLARARLPDGMLVTGAQDGTSAADLRLEDVLLTKVDGRRVGSSIASYCRAAGGARSGDRHDMTVITRAGGREQTVAVEFN